MICLNRDFIALLLRVLFQFANIPSAPRLALYYLTSQIRDCWNYQERFRLKRWGEEVIPDHFCLVKTKKNRKNSPQWTNGKNQTGKLPVRLLKRLYASPSFRLRVCTVPYKADVPLLHAQELENMARYKRISSLVSLLYSFFFYFVGYFPNL